MCTWMVQGSGNIWQVMDRKRDMSEGRERKMEGREGRRKMNLDVDVNGMEVLTTECEWRGGEPEGVVS
jgi:hypothetical protein